MDRFAAGGLAAAVGGRCDDWIHDSGLSRATVGAALHAAPATEKKKKKKGFTSLNLNARREKETELPLGALLPGVSTTAVPWKETFLLVVMVTNVALSQRGEVSWSSVCFPNSIFVWGGTHSF